MNIYNFLGVIYATDGSKGSTGMGAGFYRHDTKEADAAGWVEAPAACPAGPNLRQHAWPSKTLSPTTNPLWSSQTPRDSWQCLQIGRGRANPLSFVISRMWTYSLASSRFSTIRCVLASSLCSSKLEPIGVSFSMKRQTDGPTKGERMSTMYDGMVPARILPSHGRTRESNTDAPWIKPFRPEYIWRWEKCNFVF